MTEEQRRDRMRVMAKDGPVNIRRQEGPRCDECSTLYFDTGKVGAGNGYCPRCSFLFFVARESGRLQEFLQNRMKKRWYFCHTEDYGSRRMWYIFTSFREACNEARKLFPKD
jgi:hypothetical protein